MTVTIVQNNSHDKSAQLVQLQAQVTALAAASASSSQAQTLKKAQEDLVRSCLDARRLTAAQILLLNGGYQLATFATTGVAGQCSCAAAPGTLAVGQLVTLGGTYGGTGSISGYSSPTTYMISATNGSTTFTLQTTAGGALTTTAGTPAATLIATASGLTSAWYAKYHPEIAALTAQITQKVTAGDVSQQLDQAQQHAVDDAIAQGLMSAAGILSVMS